MGGMEEREGEVKGGTEERERAREREGSEAQVRTAPLQTRLPAKCKFSLVLIIMLTAFLATAVAGGDSQKARSQASHKFGWNAKAKTHRNRALEVGPKLEIGERAWNVLRDMNAEVAKKC